MADARLLLAALVKAPPNRFASMAERSAWWARKGMLIEQARAFLAEAQPEALDVETLLQAFFWVLSPRLIEAEAWPKGTQKADVRADIEMVAAEYARLAQQGRDL